MESLFLLDKQKQKIDFKQQVQPIVPTTPKVKIKVGILSEFIRLILVEAVQISTHPGPPSGAIHSRSQ